MVKDRKKVGWWAGKGPDRLPQRTDTSAAAGRRGTAGCHTAAAPHLAPGTNPARGPHPARTPLSPVLCGRRAGRRTGTVPEGATASL